jgi:uncharacterized protein YjbI with pentapeptide repeats
MANEKHVALLKQGVDAWNTWRMANPKIRPDLTGANLSEANLSEANLRGANLSEANLSEANLSEANLNGADLSEAILFRANLIEANLRGANLSEANLNGANLIEAKLNGANLNGADLSEAILFRANLSEANLRGANLIKADLSGSYLDKADLRGAKLFGANLGGADFREANLREVNLTRADALQAHFIGADLSGAKLGGANLGGANLSGANLSNANLNKADLFAANLVGADFREANLVVADLTGANLVNANFTGADLTGCRIFGVAAWNVELEGAKQQNLVITPPNEPAITVDNIEVAQFIYLMLQNKNFRGIIDTITSKVVLILGRFTDERKAVLDALRGELRKRNYLPILFDFAVPATRDITETVSLLARMARFIIADLTDPSSIPKELEAIVPDLAVPVQPVLEASSPEYAMFKDYWKYDWVLPVYRYEGLEPLLATLADKVIAPAEGKVNALQERRRVIEAELTKPR